jgi:crotonobetainyl-CoA:carnitine CoA-transferase CaiB-like acyl-CoA transferase
VPGDFLRGTRVLEVADGPAAAFCGRALADFGAAVVKVEPPGGDALRAAGPFAGGRPDPDRSGLFHYFNAGKRGITLDLEGAAGRRSLEGLVGASDILVTDKLRPEAERLGLTYAALGRINPDLVVVSITPWGLDGPLADYRAYPLNELHASGATYATGLPEREPLNLPDVQPAYFAGWNAAGAAITALFARERLGRGQLVDIATIETLVTILMGHGVVKAFHLGEPTQRTGHRLAGMAPHTHFRCKDGYFCVIGTQPVHWERVRAALGRPEWTESELFADPRSRYRYVEAFEDLMVAELSRHTKEEWYEIFWRYRAPGMPLNNIADVLQLEHLKARGFFAEVEIGPGLRVTMPGVPLLVDGRERPPSRRGPWLGEQADDLTPRPPSLRGKGVPWSSVSGEPDAPVAESTSEAGTPFPRREGGACFEGALRNRRVGFA